MKRTISILALAALLSCSTYRDARQTFTPAGDPAFYGLSSNNLPYQAPSVDAKGRIPGLTPAPKGYKPFYLSHYGRHGSRWQIHSNRYTDIIKILEDAASQGVLTPFGAELLTKTRQVYELAEPNLEGLTPLGQIQHRGVAERMLRNFPEIFAGKVRVDARSSVIPRCILSMDAALRRMAELNPRIDFTVDASNGDMAWISSHDSYKNNHSHGPLYDEASRLYKKAFDYSRIMSSLFTDEAFAAGIDKKDFVDKLYTLAACQQNNPGPDVSFEGLFTPEELQILQEKASSSWYISGVYDYSPYRKRSLLYNIIEVADTCLASGRRTATLRFGHDSALIALDALMEVDSCGIQTADMATLASRWRNYDWVPMGANLQLIFYRKPSDPSAPVLVKCLVNEHEARLPISSDLAPYYPWNELRDYYLAKLSAYEKTIN